MKSLNTQCLASSYNILFIESFWPLSAPLTSQKVGSGQCLSQSWIENLTISSHHQIQGALLLHQLSFSYEDQTLMFFIKNLTIQADNMKRSRLVSFFHTLAMILDILEQLTPQQRIFIMAKESLQIVIFWNLVNR